MTATRPVGQDEHGAELLRAIVEGSADAVFVKDREGRHVLCNAAAARMFGRDAGEVVGRPADGRGPPEAAAAGAAVDRRTPAGGGPETTEEHIVVGGERRTWTTTRSPYRAADGAIVGVIAVARDVTERDAERLRQGEHVLRLVLDTLPVGVLVVDPAGDIIVGNSTARHIWGRSIHRGSERWTKSQGWFHESGAPVRPHDWASVRAIVEGVPHLDQLIDIVGFDGSRRTIRNSAVPFVQPTGVVGAVILNEDVTERLRLEARLVQAKKMAAVGQLAGGVAHDFNNLLTVIMTYASLVADSLDGGDPRGADVEEMRKAADSAGPLWRPRLPLGLRPAGPPRARAAAAAADPAPPLPPPPPARAPRNDAQPLPVRLESVVRAVEQRLARVIGDDIRLTTRLAEPGHVVWIDPVHLDQIVMNLAVNGRDAMPAGGEPPPATRGGVRTADEARAPGLPGAGGYAVLSVADTGTGMDPRTRARMFEPFFTTKERDRGTGLGLAIVFAIVETSGGAIHVTTEPGRGTTIEIELPLSPRAVREVVDA